MAGCCGPSDLSDVCFGRISLHQAHVDRMIVERLVDLTAAVKQSNSALTGLREELRDDLDYQENRLRAALLPVQRRPDGMSTASSAMACA